MLVKCTGIVLNNTKYSENSIITNIYTKEYGKLGFLVNGVRNNKGAIRNSHLQVLNLVELDIYYNPNKPLHRIKELKVTPLLHDMHSDPIKIMVVCFMAETVVKSIKEEEENEALFQFLYASIMHLEESKNNTLGSFPAFFLLKLASHLGHEIDFSLLDTHKQLDLFSGHLVRDMAQNKNQVINEKDTKIIQLLLTQKFEVIKEQNWNKPQRINTLNQSVKYFEQVVLDGPKIKSLSILKQVLS